MLSSSFCPSLFEISLDRNCATPSVIEKEKFWRTLTFTRSTKNKIHFPCYAINPALNKEEIWAWVSSLSYSWNLSCCNFSLIQGNFAIHTFNFHPCTITLAEYWLGLKVATAQSKKEFLSLFFTIQKTRHYLVGQIIHIISRVNPLWIIKIKPSSLNSRLANWTILLSQYDMTFAPQKAIKGQALTNFLAAHPVLKTSKLLEDIPNEVIEANMTSNDDVWQMCFNGASRTGSKGKIIIRVGVVFISPNNHVLPRAFSLMEPCSNNVAEYNALLISLQLTQQMGVIFLEACGDPSWSLVRLKKSMRFGMKIWYHITMQPSNWIICLMTSISVMYLAFKI